MILVNMIPRSILFNYLDYCNNKLNLKKKDLWTILNFKVIPVFDIDDSIVYPSPYQNMPVEANEQAIEIQRSSNFRELLKNATLAPWVMNPNYSLFSLFDLRPRIYVTGRHEFQANVTIEYLKRRNLFDEDTDCIYFLNFINLDDYHQKKVKVLKEIIKIINETGLKACVIEDSLSIFNELVKDKDFLKDSRFSYHLIYQGLPIFKFETYAFNRE